MLVSYREYTVFNRVTTMYYIVVIIYWLESKSHQLNGSTKTAKKAWNLWDFKFPSRIEICKNYIRLVNQLASDLKIKINHLHSVSPSKL